jgi:hypothetical protein
MSDDKTPALDEFVETVAMLVDASSETGGTSLAVGDAAELLHDASSDSAEEVAGCGGGGCFAIG